MEKNICAWLCLDPQGEESSYSQMNSFGKSTSHKFISVYLKNCVVFYVSCRKFNPTANLLFFTNSDLPEQIDGVNYRHLFDLLGVRTIMTEFEYRTPAGYYGAWRCQFFEFSIFSKMLQLSKSEDDLFLLLDSDCVVTGDLAPLWDMTLAVGAVGYELEYDADHVINGLTRRQMKSIYEGLLNTTLDRVPSYYGGELFAATTASIRRIIGDFPELWQTLLARHQRGELKFHEEGHTISFLFYKNGFETVNANAFIKRLWTQPFIYRNVVKEDAGRLIWHLPHEKKYGMLALFPKLSGKVRTTLAMDNSRFKKLLSRNLTIPNIPVWIYVSRLIPVQTARFIQKGVKKIAAFL